MKRRLGSMEQAFTLAGEFEPLVVVGVLHLRSGPKPETLHQALAQLQLSHPLLQAKIVPVGKQYYFQLVRPLPPLPLALVPREKDDQWHQVATEALNTMMVIGTDLLWRCIYVYQPGSDQLAELIFVFHHAILDATSGALLYDQLLALCAELEAVEGAKPSVRHPSQLEAPGAEKFVTFPPLDDRLPPAMSGWRRWWQLLKFMRRQMGDEIQYRRHLGSARQAPLHPQAADCRILTRSLDQETTSQIIRLARRRRITMPTVVSTALLLAVHKQLYAGAALPLRAITFADLRPYLQPLVPERELGLYVAMLRHTIAVAAAPDFWQTAATFQAITTKATAQGEKFLSGLVAKPLMRMLIGLKKMRLAATAVSYPGPLQLQPAYGEIQLLDMHAFISNNRLGPEYTAFAKILFGRLSWDMLYLDLDMSAEMAAAIADEIVEILVTLRIN